MFPFWVCFGLTWRTPCPPARRRPSRSAGLGCRLSFRRCLLEPLEDRSLLAPTWASITSFTILRLVTAASRRRPPPPAPTGLTPAQIRTAYGISSIALGGVPGDGTAQTIAIVDAYNDPSIVSDAAAFNTQFDLQQFNVSGGPTFTVLNQTGGTSLPGLDPNGPASSTGQVTWEMEESMDVEWAHAVAPQANIALFEANSASMSDLATAVQTAAANSGVSVVSMSFGN